MKRLRTDQWQGLWQLFEAALEKPPEERASFLSQSRAGPTILREVEELLVAHGESANPLDQGPRLVDVKAPESLKRLGKFDILRQLGRGGMGVVYLAQRRDGEFEQQVAIKVIHPGHDDLELRRRFHQERRILARLVHPGIARLYDGGTTDTGQPYFVMEYVEGRPIDRFCQEEGLGLDERLDLFLQVGEAVDFAHRNLIIHRDLKPSNILVTADGTPKLLDFGIAKLLDPGAEDLQTTRREDRRLTPEFASPEQILGQPVTTASDVYSLGVLLYRLLSGSPPYDLEGLTWSAIEREVCEKIPGKPSRHSSEVPARWRRRLRGDLDNIALRALTKESEGRYGSVGQFLSDLRRFQEGRPVEARPAGTLYRLGKFVRRNPGGVGAAALIVLLVFGFGVQSARQAEETAQALEKAEVELDRSERVLAYLVNHLKVAEPDRLGGHTITAKELLRRSVEQLRELDDEPHVQVFVIEAIAGLHLELSLGQESYDLYQRAQEMRRSLGETDSRAVLKNRTRMATALRFVGRYDEAAELQSANFERLQQEDPEQFSGLISYTLESLGTIYGHLGAKDQAEKYLRQAVEFRRQNGSRYVAHALDSLGSILADQGKLEEARSTLEEALELHLEELGPRHLDVAFCRVSLGKLAMDQGDFKAAEREYDIALDQLRDLLGPESRHVASVLRDLGSVRYRLSDHEGAEPILREAVELDRKLLGPDHPRLGYSLNALSLALQSLGQLDEAEALLNEALELHRRTLGDDHAQISVELNNLALIRQGRGDYLGAAELFREAVETQVRIQGDEHPNLAYPLTNLGRALHQGGDLASAEAPYRQALDLRRRFVPDHPSLGTTLAWFGFWMVEVGQPAEAEAFLREAVTIRSSFYGEDNWRTAEARSMLGSCLVALGRSEEGRRLMTAAHEQLVEKRGEDHAVTLQAARRLETFGSMSAEEG